MEVDSEIQTADEKRLVPEWISEVNIRSKRDNTGPANAPWPPGVDTNGQALGWE